MTSLIKPKSSGSKPSDRKRTRNPDFESPFDRLDKNENECRKSFMFQNPNPRKRYCMSHLSVQWHRALLTDARENVGICYFSDKEDYLVVKSRGCIKFMNKEGKMSSKCFPLYTHFKAECLK